MKIFIDTLNENSEYVRYLRECQKVKEGKEFVGDTINEIENQLPSGIMLDYKGELTRKYFPRLRGVNINSQLKIESFPAYLERGKEMEFFGRFLVIHD